MSSIDKLFKGYGVEFFGEEPMRRVTDAQIEEARVFAFNECARLTEKYGPQTKGTTRELFLNYLWGEYL